MLGKLIKGLFTNDEAQAPVPARPPVPAPAAQQAPPQSQLQAQPEAAPAFVPPHLPSAYQGKIFVTFLSNSRSDGLASGAFAFADITRAAGYEHRLIDVRQENWRAEVQALMGKPEEICCLFSTMGFGDGWVSFASGRNKPLWREAGIPFLSAFGDHPAYFWDRHISRGPGYSSIYCFQEHLDAAMAWLNPQPMAGLLPPWPRDPVDRNQIDFQAKRSGKIFFFKNGNDPEALLRFWRTLPQPLCRWLLEISHSVNMCELGRSLKPLHLLVGEFLHQQDFYPGPAPWITAFMVAQLDDYARRIKSTLIANAILDLPVHIFGDNWSHVDFTGRRATHSPGQSYFQTRDLVKDALAVIDMSPNTESAPHERFMGAMGRYTLCLGNAQRYHLENYPEAGRMLFEFEADSIRERVSAALGDPAGHVDYGVAVGEHGRRLHAPAKVVEAVVEFARMTRFAAAPSEFAGQQDFLAWPALTRWPPD